jgi:hypothetical protein
MSEVIATTLSQHQFSMWLFAALAGLAFLLATVGIYSVLAYSVRSRMHEIGVRIALGARPADVIRLVVAEGMRPTLIGVAVGAAGAFALGGVLSKLVYGVSPADPLTFITVAVLLSAVARGVRDTGLSCHPRAPLGACAMSERAPEKISSGPAGPSWQYGLPRFSQRPRASLSPPLSSTARRNPSSGSVQTGRTLSSTKSAVARSDNHGRSPEVLLADRRCKGSHGSQSTVVQPGLYAFYGGAT